jgi:hypothetical protein
MGEVAGEKLDTWATLLDRYAPLLLGPKRGRTLIGQVALLIVGLGLAAAARTPGDLVPQPVRILVPQTLGDTLTTGGLVGLALLAGLAVAGVRAARGGGPIG